MQSSVPSPGPRIPALRHTSTRRLLPRDVPSLRIRYLIPPPIQPPPPHPWFWECNRCHTTYNLGITRRCLEDGFYFSAKPLFPPPNSLVVPDPPSLLEEGKTPVPFRYVIELARRRARRKPILIKKHFDYMGWATWNIWRRMVNGDKLVGSSLQAWRPKYKGGTPNSHDCVTDCDSPGECCERRRVEQENREKIAGMAIQDDSDDTNSSDTNDTDSSCDDNEYDEYEQGDHEDDGVLWHMDMETPHNEDSILEAKW